jgi:hypothetical protein
LFKQNKYIIKKVLFTILSLFILSCSSDDNDNNDNIPDTSINSDLVGTWVGSTVSDDNPTNIGVQTIVFNADGTGSVTEVFLLPPETFEAELTWYSDATTIFGTLEGQLDEIGYVLSEQNQMLQLTFPEGDVGEYVRLD